MPNNKVLVNDNELKNEKLNSEISKEEEALLEEFGTQLLWEYNYVMGK